MILGTGPCPCELSRTTPDGESEDEKERREQARDALVAERNALGEEIAGSMTEFKQNKGDHADQPYGSAATENVMAENGCMPTALAMTVNFYQQEQVENLADGTYGDVFTPYDASVADKYEVTPDDGQRRRQERARIEPRAGCPQGDRDRRAGRSVQRACLRDDTRSRVSFGVLGVDHTR